eukprot:TRINITY_DN67210_c1_g1_i1.p1 TRINITY_DN67210_c1_g1~~TRINITY_DN67210_c1_g1_i1.p1  ORF type:complete len:217 (+),score=22.85 TRINITY_DN67210_c1_g1_i1:401-1051(+)
MLHSGKWQPDAEGGQYFIDRSPQMFGLILDYLRNGKVRKPDSLTTSDKELLQAELDFYSISSFPIPNSLCWNSRDTWGDSDTFWFDNDNHKLIVYGTAPSERLLDTEPFPQEGKVHFTLEVFAVDAGITFWFGKFGISLGSGQWSFHSGNLGTWKPAFQTKDSINQIYHFLLVTSTRCLTITGPMGGQKTVTLTEMVDCGTLAVGPATGEAHCSIK